MISILKKKGMAVAALMGIPLLAILVFNSCSEPELYQGLYIQGFEKTSFRMCGSDESWWVIPDNELANAYQSLGVAPYTEVYVELKGERSNKGSYGHLGAYPYQLTVRELVKIDTIAPFPCR